jgi:hypothetical protein
MGLLEFAVELLEFVFPLPFLDLQLDESPKHVIGAAPARECHLDSFFHLEKVGIGFADDIVNLGEERLADHIFFSLFRYCCLDEHPQPFPVLYEIAFQLALSLLESMSGGNQFLELAGRQLRQVNFGLAHELLRFVVVCQLSLVNPDYLNEAIDWLLSALLDTQQGADNLLICLELR